MDHVFVGRQPIFDRQLEVHAYELLYRSGQSAQAAGALDGDRATATVMLNSLLEIGLDRLVGDRPAYVNMTRGLLLSADTLPFPPGRVTLEVLEDVEADTPIVDAVRRLSQAGFEIALDDFVLTPQVMPLVELADVIKIDVMATDRARLPEQLKFLRRFDVKLLAEKVETQADFTQCRDLGFDYFQGYFFCRPTVVNAQRLPDNRLATVRLLAELQDPEADIDRLETLISQNVGLGYKLLRYVNSAAVGMRRRMTAIREAIVVLGLTTIRSLAALMTISEVDDKPSELIKVAMTRARACQQLAEACGGDKAMYFTIGLLSVLDALLDAPMAAVLEPLPLGEEVKTALLERSGRAGEVLAAVVAFQEDAGLAPAPDCLTPAAIAQAYVSAVEWAEQSYRSML